MAKKDRKNKEEKAASTKVVLKPKGGLLATFVHLLEPDDFGGHEKYTVTVIIPKSDKKTVKAVKEAIKAAMDRGAAETFKGKNMKKAHNPLKDGNDEDAEKYEYYKDAYVLKFSTTQKPNVIDRGRNKLTEDEDVYSGMMIYVSGAAFPFFTDGSWGVSMILGNVVKVDDGERIGGGGFDLEDEFGDDLDENDFADDEDEDDDYEEDTDDEDEDDDYEEDTDDEDEDDEDDLDYSEAEEAIEDAEEIDGGKRAVKKLLKKFKAKKLEDITDEDDLDDFIDELSDWIEENE